MEESFLTEYVRADLEKIGFITYAEVCVKGGGDKRADLFGRIEDPLQENYGETVAFEAKLNFNLKVLQQAQFWTNRAHRSYIIVPSTTKDLGTRKFARELCKLLGIGVMEVNIQKEQYHVTVQSGFCKNPIIPPLYPEQRFIRASNAQNQYMTPYKVTAMSIYDFFIDKQFAYISDIIANIKHHYKSDVAASKAIKYLIENKVLKGFYIVKKNHKIVIGKTQEYLIELDKMNKLKNNRANGLQNTN